MGFLIQNGLAIRATIWMSLFIFVLLWLGIPAIKHRQFAEHVGVTDGTIAASDLNTRDSSRFTYSVDSKSYTAEYGVDDRTERRAAGDSVRVYYDKSEPTTASLTDPREQAGPTLVWLLLRASILPTLVLLVLAAAARIRSGSQAALG